MLSLILAFQSMSPAESTAVDRLKGSGASVRVEQPLEVWVDFDGPFKDEYLKPIRGLTSLTVLRILTDGPTDQGLDPLRDVPRLWLLVVRSTKITDVGVAKIAKLKSLKKLDFIGATVSQRGVRHLYGLPLLEQLYLYGAKMDDKALRALAPMKQLKILDIPDSTPDATFNWLKQQLPKTDVKRI